MCIFIQYFEKCLNLQILLKKKVLQNIFVGVLHKALERMRMSKWRTFSHKYDRWRKQTVCERHFTMTCSGPRSRTRTSAVYLKMWRVSKHLRQSTYEWAGGVCVSCLRALQSWLMCIESSCVMHRHTHIHACIQTHTSRSCQVQQCGRFFPSSLLWLLPWQQAPDFWIWKVESDMKCERLRGGGGDNKRGVDRSRCGPPLPPPPAPPQCVCTGPLRGADCSLNIDSYVICAGLRAPRGSRVHKHRRRLLLTLSYSSTPSTERRSSVRKKKQTWNHFKIFFSDSLLVFRCFSWE